MRLKSSIFVLLFLSFWGFGAIQTDEIAAIRSRAKANQGNVSDSDKSVIAKFIRTAIDTMFLSDDSTEVAEIRRQIVRQKGTQDLSLYATAYVTEAREQLRSAFETASSIQDPQRQIRMRRNLTILAAELNSLLLLEFGIEKIADQDAVIRYWAIKTIAGPAIVAQLNLNVSSDAEKATKIYETLVRLIEKENKSVILSIIAGFGKSWEDLRSQELLRRLVDERVEAYQSWKVEHEWLDSVLLKTLADKYAALKLPDEKAAMGREFSRLFAVVLQRWMKGQEVMTEQTKNQIFSVLMEADLILEKQFEIRIRLKGNPEPDQRYFEDLLGTATKAGDLGSRLKFSYIDSEGQLTTAPPLLGEPPAELVQQTEETSDQG